jgi:hypothetical protein
MKKFNEPVIEIIRLAPTDILASSSELIGWAGFGDFDVFSNDIDTGDKPNE